jgi:hypothetical protein
MKLYKQETVPAENYTEFLSDLSAVISFCLID